MREYRINNQVVTVQGRSLSYSDRVNERTTCSFTVIDPPFEIQTGMEVLITEDGEIIFKGSVNNPKASGDFVKLIGISCVDYSQLIDTLLVAETYTNTLAGDIARDFITKYFAAEGVTEGNIQDGPLIAKATFPYINSNVAMNDIAEKAGFSWYIDNDKKLHFFERSTFTAPFELTDTSANYKGLTVERPRGQYRNRQYIRAGKDVSDLMPKEKPSPKPDGVSRTFVVRLPIAEKPTIYIDNVALPDGDIGVNGLDKDKKFYFSYNSNTITQDDSQPVLLDTQKLEVSYRGLYPILIVAENPGEIAARKAIEGGSGIYESIEDAESIDSRQAAIDFANSKLDKYGIIPRIVTFSTHVKGLKAGQLLSINNTFHGLSGTFLIESVSGRDNGGIMQYSVKCLDGSTLGGWEQFFKRLLQGNRKLVIRENEVLIKLLSFRDSFTYPKFKEGEFKFWLHQYRLCGDTQPLYGAVCGSEVYI